MALLLSLESSARYCSVALHREGVCLAEWRSTSVRSAASELAPAIRRIGEQAGIRFTDLDAVAVAGGPGSYTGLRISTSLAKGLVAALSIPMISIGSLDAVVQAFRRKPEAAPAQAYGAVLDARRMEVYVRWFNGAGVPLTEVSAHVLTTESFSTHLTEGICWLVGDAAEKCRSVISHPNARFLEVEPDAPSVGDLAWQAFLEKRFVDVHAFEPAYLKEFMPGRKPDLTGAGQVQ